MHAVYMGALSDLSDRPFCPAWLQYSLSLNKGPACEAAEGRWKGRRKEKEVAEEEEEEGAACFHFSLLSCPIVRSYPPSLFFPSLPSLPC